MTRTVVAFYEDLQQAHDAVQDLTNSGIPRENISLVSKDSEGSYSEQLGRGVDETAENVGKGAGAGAVIGGLGGLVVGLGALAIPGIGPVVAAGPIATTLAGAGIGAVAGGMVGALVDLGVPEEQAELYTEGIRRGGTLVTVQTEDSHADRVIDLLNRHNPIDIERQRQQWGKKEETTYQNDPGTHSQDRSDAAREGYEDTSVSEQPIDRDVQLRSDWTRTTGMENQRDYEQQWRMHFQQINQQGRFEDYMPVYQYGYELNQRENYRNRNWLNMEQEVQLDWELRNPDYPYYDYREYIRAGWESGQETPQ